MLFPLTYDTKNLSNYNLHIGKESNWIDENVTRDTSRKIKTNKTLFSLEYLSTLSKSMTCKPVKTQELQYAMVGFT